MATEQQQNQQQQDRTPKPEVTDEHLAEAKRMKDSYEEERPTVTMPGTAGTVAGTAVNEWLDDDGNPKYGEVSADGGVKREDTMGKREKGMVDE
jgi:hypothetical protein